MHPAGAVLVAKTEIEEAWDGDIFCCCVALACCDVRTRQQRWSAPFFPLSMMCMNKEGLRQQDT